MPDRCLVGGCSNENSPQDGISLHRFPFFGDERPEAVRRRSKWINFVNESRSDPWSDSKYSVICFEHFTKTDFIQGFILDIPNTKASKARLKKDEFGLCVYPTIRKTVIDVDVSSAREKRQVT